MNPKHGRPQSQAEFLSFLFPLGRNLRRFGFAGKLFFVNSQAGAQLHLGTLGCSGGRSRGGCQVCLLAGLLTTPTRKAAIRGGRNRQRLAGRGGRCGDSWHAGLSRHPRAPPGPCSGVEPVRPLASHSLGGDVFDRRTAGRTLLRSGRGGEYPSSLQNGGTEKKMMKKRCAKGFMSFFPPFFQPEKKFVPD